MAPLGRGCSRIALACSEALVLDATVPRPGLSSILRPRAGQEPRGFLRLPGLAAMVCRCSCRLAASRGRGWSWRCWLPAVRSLAGEGLGNPGLGSLFLLSLLSAAYGRRPWAQSDWAVMGASREALEAEGVEGAVAFYRGLQAAAPGYLSRLSWAGLPDATMGRLALRELRERRVTLAELADAASLYDPVLRDASRLLSTSIGLLKPFMEELLGQGVGLAEAFRRATFLALALEGDLLLRRKRGTEYREAALEAAEGSASAEAGLWRLLREAGPGSAADLAAAAAAWLLATRPGPLRLP